jgi:disulfide bond formation protein DsbB
MTSWLAVPIRFLAALTLLIHALLLGLAIWALAGAHSSRARSALGRWLRRLRPASLPAAIAIALTATAGSLYSSEIAGFVPCRLCWAQRAAMYPLGPLLAAVAARPAAWWPTIAAGSLAAVGLALAGAHVWIELHPAAPGAAAACSAEIPCNLRWVWEFGYIGLPLMAATAFLSILLLLGLHHAGPLSPRPGLGAARRLALAMLAGAALLTAPAVPAPGEWQPVQTSGAWLPPLPPIGPDPAEGLPAPSVIGRDFQGRPVRIPTAGQPTLVVILAHWCEACRREAPILSAWAATDKPPALALAAISTAASPLRQNYPPSLWLSRIGLAASFLADDHAGTARRAFGANAYPFFILLDRHGRVARRAAGATDRTSLDALARLSLP